MIPGHGVSFYLEVDMSIEEVQKIAILEDLAMKLASQCYWFADDPHRPLNWLSLSPEDRHKWRREAKDLLTEATGNALHDSL